MKHLGLMALVAMVLSGCPQQGVVCRAGTLPCGLGCIDPTSDRRNCGACGTACGQEQDCAVPTDGGNTSSCECRLGTTSCNGTCVVTDYDAANCGACGNACATGQVCQVGTCQASCENGLTRCVDSCVDALNDASNCGGCGTVCAQAQRCVSGTCSFPAVAACYWSGQVIGFDPVTGVKGTLSGVGTNPAALSRVGETVLVADGTDQRLYSAATQTDGTLLQSRFAVHTGQVPNHMLVERPYVYVTNAGAGTVLILQEGVDSGVLTLDAGTDGVIVFGTIAELPMGMNTFPQASAKIGSTLYVPLYGGYGAANADAGQEVALVDVSTPSAPVISGRVSLRGVDLHPFDGGTPVARPWAVTAKGDAVYVALNNLNADSYAPEGPGLLAKVNTDAGLSIIDLGARCLNPQWVNVFGDGLVVSCGGKSTYGPSGLSAVEGQGVVLVDSTDVVQAAAPWTLEAGTTADGGAGFWLPGRLAVKGPTVLVTDQFLGRVSVLGVVDGGLALTTPAINVCPVSSTAGVANVSDVSF